MTLVGQVVGRLNSPGRTRRRSWATHGRLHAEVRGLSGASAALVGDRVCAVLSAQPGVVWAVIDQVQERVVVAFVPELTTPGRLLEVIAGAEGDLGLSDTRFAVERPEHPADIEPVIRHLLALGADVAGLGLVGFGRLLRSTPLPVEAASVATLIDNEPRLRRFFESHLGTASTDLGLAVVNAAGQGLTQGPFGVIADGVHRANLLAEAVARRRAWVEAESRLHGIGAESRIVGLAPARPARRTPVTARPTRLPDGPVETFTDRSSLAGLATSGVVLASTGNPRRAASVVIATVPKAARLGREAFAAHLDRALAARDLLVLDATCLRRLDRVDTVVLDGGLLVTGRFAVSAVRLLKGADAVDVHRHIATMFDPKAPLTLRRRGRWSLGPPTAQERRRVAIREAQLGLAAEATAVVRVEGQAVAVVGIAAERSAAAAGLIQAARRQGHMVAIAGASPREVEACGADLAVDGAEGLAGAIEQMQQDGCVVALVCPGGSATTAALQAADVSVELPSLDGAAWSGDIIINDLHDAAFVIDGVGVARQVSRQSVALSATGSGLAALLSLSGPPGRAASRASSAVNAAALLALANGVRAASYLNRYGGRVRADPAGWHQMEVDQVAARLASRVEGLTDDEADRRRRDDTASDEPGPSLLRSLVQELANPLTPVLLGGAAASAAVGSPTDAAIVAGVTALNTLIGGAQRFGAERAIRALTERTGTDVMVRRPSGDKPESVDRLVPGDVVVLQAGDAVPADCRVVATSNLEVDESALTGESETVSKGATSSFSEVLADRTSMLYEGTTIAAGEVIAMVVAIGEDTAVSTMGADQGESKGAGGVEARLRRLTSLTLPVAAAGGGAVLGLGLLRRRSLERSVGSAVALAVAAVPEGLPLLATMAQLASARRLAERHALVRNPRAIEALGRVRVLCTDKTGTLTEGRIRLQRISDGAGDVAPVDLGPHHRRIIAAGLRASPARTGPTPLPHLTDRAVVDGARLCDIGADTEAAGWERRHELPFEPDRGFHATVGKLAGRSVETVLLSCKGAPEAVIPRCTHWRRATGSTVIDATVRRRLDHEVDRLARQGLRILAVAEVERSPNAGPLTDEDVTGLELLGFLVLSDPVRPTAALAITSLRQAGVDVVMVTGDHPSTAEGIAAELGILNGHRVATGTDLAAMTDPELDAMITEISVFARVTPADKTRIVRALQRRGQAVAMTGDGANDAPAIRLADVGIALGSQATPAARRAADLVVTDERIETIVDAIIEGRAMWASVREALAILLGGNLGEVAFTVAATALTGRSPLSARQLLAVNLLTDVAPALAIAVRPPPDRSPRALLLEGPDASLGGRLERAIAIRASATALGAGAAWTAARLTGRQRRASTTALVALVGSQLGQTITSGGTDPLILAAGFGSAFLLAAIVQTPGPSQFFDCTPLGPVAWGIAVSSAAVATTASVVGSRLAGPEATSPLLRPAQPVELQATRRASSAVKGA